MHFSVFAITLALIATSATTLALDSSTHESKYQVQQADNTGASVEGMMNEMMRHTKRTGTSEFRIGTVQPSGSMGTQFGGSSMMKKTAGGSLLGAATSALKKRDRKMKRDLLGIFQQPDKANTESGGGKSGQPGQEGQPGKKGQPGQPGQPGSNGK